MKKQENKRKQGKTGQGSSLPKHLLKSVRNTVKMEKVLFHERNHHRPQENQNLKTILEKCWSYDSTVVSAWLVGDFGNAGLGETAFFTSGLSPASSRQVRTFELLGPVRVNNDAWNRMLQVKCKKLW